MSSRETVNAMLNEFTRQVKIAFGEKLSEVILFGSYARGDFDSESDVDIMILMHISRNDEITTDPSDFTAVREKLEEAGLSFLEAEVQMVPTTTVVLDEAGQEKMERLIERLDELDDVMNVYHNWEE